MWLIINPTIIARPEIVLRQDLPQFICWLEWFDLALVQSMPQMLIYPQFPLLAKWLSLLKVVCWLKWMPWIPLFWVLGMLVVQSSCFAICFPPRIFHSNFLTLSVCLSWIRVHVRSGFWGSIVSSSGGSWSGGAPGTVSMVRSLVD